MTTTTNSLTVKIALNDRGQPPGKIADAELHFADGPLAGLKLIGFAVWERRDGARTVTFPARQYSVNGERRCAGGAVAGSHEVMTGTIAAAERRNVFGVLSGTPERVDTWRRASGTVPSRRQFPTRREEHADGGCTGELHAKGRLAVLGEITNQYAGIPPDDPRMDPYWAMAEALDVPVGIHVGPGPPGVTY